MGGTYWGPFKHQLFYNFREIIVILVMHTISDESLQIKGEQVSVPSLSSHIKSEQGRPSVGLLNR